MALKLYKMDISAPSCAVMMICEIHKIPVEMIDTNLIENDHLKPEYIKKNPMHTVPVLEDDNLIIHDSHAIITYLTDKYGKDDSLYPKDLKKRVQVDQKLYFDVLLFNRMVNITIPAIFAGVRKPAENLLNALRETYDFLEVFLTNTKFVAANHMTVADISVVATVAAARYIVPIDAKKYPKIQAWFSFMENQSFYQKSSARGTAELKRVLSEKLDL